MSLPTFTDCPGTIPEGEGFVAKGKTDSCATTTMTASFNGTDVTDDLTFTCDPDTGAFEVMGNAPKCASGESNVLIITVSSGGNDADCDIPVERP